MKKKNHGKVDPVRVQVAIKVPKIKGIKKLITPEFLQRAMEQFVETGEPPTGIEIKTIRWINPVRKNDALAVWKSSDDDGESIENARATLRGLLRQLRYTFQNVGTR